MHVSVKQTSKFVYLLQPQKEDSTHCCDQVHYNRRHFLSFIGGSRLYVIVLSVKNCQEGSYLWDSILCIHGFYVRTIVCTT